MTASRVPEGDDAVQPHGVVLVVDDSEANRDVLCRRLIRAGYSTIAACGGEQALALIGQQPCDLVLLDIKMPDRDGLDVLRTLRATYTPMELPVIMVTIVDRSTEIVEALTHGANDYVTKPLDLPVVLARIRTQLSLKWASAALRDAKEAAEHATQAKAACLAAVSHELRTPMNGVLGMLDALRQTGLTSEQRDYVDTATHAAGALVRLTDDLLDFSKIEAGKVELETIAFDLRQVVEDVTTLFAKRAQSKGLNLVCYIAPDMPERLCGDPTRLRQILTNLLGNAVKFTERGEVVVRVTWQAASPLDVHLRCEVQDTGIGITRESQARLFQAFTQAEHSITRKYGGTGLGLAITKCLVELMGGCIGVESIPTQGTTFWCTVRCALADHGLPPLRPALPPMPVLIVDDHATSCDIVAQYLQAWGMRPVSTTHAQEALEKLRVATDQGQPYVLLLLDTQIYCSDEAAPLRQMIATATPAHTRVILLKTLGQPAEALTDLEVDAWLSKPLRQQALYDLLVSVLQASPASVPRPPAPVEVRQLRCQGRLLLVDDEPINRKVVQALLKRLDCVTVDCVNNGREAVAAVRQGHYDVVLMDCVMPEMDGYVATRCIRQDEQAHGGKRLPIIAMTASTLQGDPERCQAAGMDDYVSKPVQWEALIAVLSRWLEV
jgi:signal transduction histidine kinase